MTEGASRTVTVNPERTRFVVTTVRVDEKTGEQCERCGVDLWTRDGAGRYEVVAFVDAGPVLQLHGWLTCNGWLDTCNGWLDT